MAPGFAFPLGPKDATQQSTYKNQSPGPGSHDLSPLHSGIQRSILGGKLESEGIIDNGNPGPATYEIKSIDKIPNFLISKPSPRTKQFETWQEYSAPKKVVGPETYSPKYPSDFNKGVKIGRSERKEEQTTAMLTPAPNHYSFTGDFDFRDPTDPNSHSGKNPKFAYGIKPALKSNNLDFPGPGTYFGDGNPQPLPMNQPNISYWIGTDIRRDMSVPNSHLLPGPGEYEPDQSLVGPHVR